MVPENMNDKIVCIVGLGYVGLPLAYAFSKHLKTIGFDVNKARITQINMNNHEENLICTSDSRYIKKADFVLICVPTPVTKSKDPDLSYIRSAAEIVGQNLKKGGIVALESTVYPGVTEEIVVPILEKESGLRCGIDFKVGYSPERINPGDEEHSLEKITKIVAGMDKETSDSLSSLYGMITTVYQARDIQTAEAAKVIENIQRDLNIALMNELSKIFEKMGLDTSAVLSAAGTKWNFHRYSPGLVGGHCIPVDPYYLVHKASELGYHSRVILAGRAINDQMPKYVAQMMIKGLNEATKVIKGSKVLIMGLTYKEDIPDIRESPSAGIVQELKEFGVNVYGYDPMLTKMEIDGFGIAAFNHEIMDGVIVAVAHDEFRRMNLKDLRQFMNDKPVLVDVRGIYSRENGIKEFYYRTL